MKPEELISSVKIKLNEKEHKLSKEILNAIYSKFEHNISMENEEHGVNVWDFVSNHCQSNHYKNIEKVFGNIIGVLKEEGYYVKGKKAYISYDLYKKDKIENIISILFFIPWIVAISIVLIAVWKNRF